MSKLKLRNGKIVKATQKEVDKYEAKILGGFYKDKVSKRKVTRLARPFRIGIFIDRNINRVHAIFQLVLGRRRGRNLK